MAFPNLAFQALFPQISNNQPTQQESFHSKIYIEINENPKESVKALNLGYSRVLQEKKYELLPRFMCKKAHRCKFSNL